jgi:UDP-N-acetylglucosamine acyltransferase
MANVVVMGDTTIGRDNVFYPGCVIGAAPQDLKHDGSDTRLCIGDHNVFREHVTVHTATVLGGAVTTIGSHNQFQVGTHIAHDVNVGNHCVLSNGVQVAGHVVIEDYVNISGIVGVHQFVTLGRYCFIAGMARCSTDVPPFLMFSYDGTLTGVNVKGLARWGFDDEQCERLRRLYRQLFPRRGREEESRGPRTLLEMLFSRRARRGALSLSRRIEEAEASGLLDEHCQYLVEFLKRSLLDGRYGRYLESARRDANLPPPKFYAVPVEAASPVGEGVT